MYKKDLALNNLQWLICHKPNQTKLITMLLSNRVATTPLGLSQLFV